LSSLFMLNETPSSSLELASNRDHRITFAPVFLRPAVENSLRNMNPRHRCRVFLFQLTTQRQQTTHMIPVEVSKHNFLHVAQLHVQFTSILQYGVWASPGVYENAMSVGFNQRREPPFSYSCVCQHCRDDRHFQRVDLVSLGRTSLHLTLCECGSFEEDQEG